mmetsp:Transcript_5070/g.9014  ORF Transcript_5070/g.9014 Transcript_5070/m.9014 type:complete len:452 (-) Transcript_5070:407-1762(-)
MASSPPCAWGVKGRERQRSSLSSSSASTSTSSLRWCGPSGIPTPGLALRRRGNRTKASALRSSEQGQPWVHASNVNKEAKLGLARCYPNVETELESAGKEKEREKEKKTSGVKTVPLPLTAREMVLQTANSVFETEMRGGRLQVVEWLLPVNQRRLDFLTTDPTVVQPVSTFEEFIIANTLASVLLEGTEERDVISSRLDDGIDSEPVGLLRTEDSQYIAVVFPTADVIDEIRELARKNKSSTILLVNPQWTMQGNIVSDFGFGFRRKRAEDFLSKFVTSYSLLERRIGNNIGPNFNNGVSGVVRLLKASRKDWQIHIMSNNIGILRQPAVIRKAYPSYGELCSLLTAYEMRRRGLTLDQLKDSLKEKVDKEKSSSSEKSKSDDESKGQDLFFTDTEINNMDKRMLTAALISSGLGVYRKDKEGKSKDLSVEEMREKLFETQKAEKTNMSR